MSLRHCLSIMCAQQAKHKYPEAPEQYRKTKITTSAGTNTVQPQAGRVYSCVFYHVWRRPCCGRRFSPFPYAAFFFVHCLVPESVFYFSLFFASLCRKNSNSAGHVPRVNAGPQGEPEVYTPGAGEERGETCKFASNNRKINRGDCYDFNTVLLGMTS